MCKIYFGVCQMKSVCQMKECYVLYFLLHCCIVVYMFILFDCNKFDKKNVFFLFFFVCFFVLFLVLRAMCFVLCFVLNRNMECRRMAWLLWLLFRV